MPPKTRFTKELILDAAFKTVREKGLDALSSRAVAKRLNSSTMPVYSCLKSKRNLMEAIVSKAFEVMLEYQTRSLTGDPFLDMGVDYVVFARDEKHLFRCITLEQHMDRFRKHMERHLSVLVEQLAAYALLKGLSAGESRKFLFQGWVYAHGLANLVNAGYYSRISREEIQDLFEYTGLRYMKGFGALENGG